MLCHMVSLLAFCCASHEAIRKATRQNVTTAHALLLLFQDGHLRVSLFARYLQRAAPKGTLSAVAVFAGYLVCWSLCYSRASKVAEVWSGNTPPSHDLECCARAACPAEEEVSEEARRSK